MKKKLIYKYVGVCLICSSIILSIISVSLALILRSKKLAFFSKENIYIESISVKMRDDAIIKGLIYVDSELKEENTKSIPTILLLHGINGRKEHKRNIIYQFVKTGFAVVSVEQRGHGESDSPSGFLGKEPEDMMEIIDFIDVNYDFANTTHMGLLGFSYGAGIGAILQAIDDRINTVVLYHPLTSLDRLMEKIPLQNLIGTTPEVTNLDNIQDAFDIANANNTKNLLLLQGTTDIIILPEVTEDFYHHINGNNRSDIALKLRPGKGHEGNEKDINSLKYSIVWFKYFYYVSSINISDLDNEINAITLFNFNYPKSNISEIFIIISSIFLFVGLSLLVVKFKILPFWYKLPIKRISDDSREGKEKYKKMMLFRTTSYIGAILITGMIFSAFNRSLLYGYFIFFPVLTIIIMLFIPSELHSNWKAEWRNWIKNDSVPFAYSFSIIIITFLYFLIFYNLIASLTMSFTIPIFSLASLPYFMVGLGSVIMDYLFLREMKGRHALILVFIRPISILIFLGFVPLPPFPILGGIFTHIMFIILTGVIIYYIRHLVLMLSKFYKNSFSLYFLVMVPFIIFYMRVFFRII